MDSLHFHFTSLHFHFTFITRTGVGGRQRGSKKGLKEIILNLTFLNFEPKNEIAFKFTRKSLSNAARARLARGFIKEIPFKIQHVQD